MVLIEAIEKALWLRGLPSDMESRQEKIVVYYNNRNAISLNQMYHCGRSTLMSSTTIFMILCHRKPHPLKKVHTIDNASDILPRPYPIDHVQVLFGLDRRARSSRGSGEMAVDEDEAGLLTIEEIY